jgi:starch phosphorylase
MSGNNASPEIQKSLPRNLLIDRHELGMDVESLTNDIRRHFNHTLGCDKHSVSTHHTYEALVIALRDRLMERWKCTHYSYQTHKCKRTFYLSMEFLLGRSLGNNLLNLGITEIATQALKNLGLDPQRLVDHERDAGLGNGGLGRLAACFLDSCATMQLPVMGYGIRYEYGMFRQLIEDGEQIEKPDHWLLHGNRWELKRPEFIQTVRFGGRVEYAGRDDKLIVKWLDTNDVLAVPYDLPIPGYRNGTVNTLRLWQAAAVEEFDLEQFNSGYYVEAVSGKTSAENMSKVLYPDDGTERGKELRLRQEYFLVSAALQDVLRRWTRDHGLDFSRFAEKICFQLNDTHPAVAVPELMRLLMDEHGLGWDEAWLTTRRSMAYTNHTLLPEALETWPVRTFRELLPRILDIIFEINAKFLSDVARRWPGDTDRQARMSIIEEGVDPQVRMAQLAIVGSFSINGVADLHTKLLKDVLFKDFHELWPAIFNNKTNGVTQRRFLALSNPKLSTLLNDTIGTEWITDLKQLERLEDHLEDAEFRRRWREVKLLNKQRLAKMVQSDTGVRCNPEALFDVQVKRIHEYKRQLLNALHIIHLYDRIKRGDTEAWTPRCVLIGGKAAPGYWMAKRIIKLINNVATVINRDSEIGDLLKVVFVPDYRVSSMEVIAPGTDLSEQISTAGKEASGTGNMKFMMNGAVTIGTLDGANIEILDSVGEENFFLFGLTTEEVMTQRLDYNPERIIREDEDLNRVMQLLESSHFNQFEPGYFDAVISSLKYPSDPWMTVADFRGYVEAQQRVAAAFRDQEHWTRLSILNTARSGVFSSDRTIDQYNREIWQMKPVAPTPLGPESGELPRNQG